MVGFKNGLSRNSEMRIFIATYISDFEQVIGGGGIVAK